MLLRMSTGLAGGANRGPTHAWPQTSHERIRAGTSIIWTALNLFGIISIYRFIMYGMLKKIFSTSTVKYWGKI